MNFKRFNDVFSSSRDLSAWIACFIFFCPFKYYLEMINTGWLYKTDDKCQRFHILSERPYVPSNEKLHREIVFSLKVFINTLLKRARHHWHSNTAGHTWVLSLKKKKMVGVQAGSPTFTLVWQKIRALYFWKKADLQPTNRDFVATH